MKNNKIIRITTVPISLRILLKGQLAFMSDYFDVIGVTSGPKSEIEEIKKNELIEVIELNMTRTISPIKDFISLIKMTLLFIKEKPQIVHTHTPKAGTIGMLAAKLARVPVRLHTVAGLPLIEEKGSKRLLLNFIEKITYFCANWVYPNSVGLKNIIINCNFCSLKKIKVLGNGSSNGIDTHYFDPFLFDDHEKSEFRSQYKISENDFVFIFVGRLVGDKGINELVNAFFKLENKENRYKLILVGPTEPELDPLKTETLLKIENNINIINVGYQDDVRPFFAISNCLVFPSYREGFPNVVMQAGAMGLPSIVTNINGCNEIIIDGENGLVIPIKDVNSLYHSMKKISLNHDFYQNVKKNSRPMIQSRYEQKMVWEAILNEYNFLLNLNE